MRSLLAVLSLVTGSVAYAAPTLPAGPPQSVTVYPNSIHLDGPRASQRLVVLGTFADGRQSDLSRDAQITPSDPKVLTVQGNEIRGIADGKTSLRVTVSGKSTQVPVTITRVQADVPVNFTREVEPILTKAGCNMGACHGAQHGRGGFRLSLLAFDPVFDYAQIVQSAEGRRVVLSEPERSILLAKPVLTMEHGGGEKLKLGSREYETIRRWLEDGAPEPALSEAKVTRLEVFPTKRLMVAGELQQLAVTAYWSDGRREDVTALAQFDALNDSVAAVTATGLVTAKAQGETHVMIRYCGQASIMQVTLPYKHIPNYPKLPANNFVDVHLSAKWRDLGLLPSPLGTDEEFYRRIHLDTIGTLPNPADIRAFLADQSPDKRAKAIDAVLNRPEYADFWAIKWGDLLRIHGQTLEEKGMWSFHNWVRASLRDNKPLDQMTREIVTAEGSTFKDGPSNFFRVGRTAEDWSETAAQIFLGVRVQCAKCHHHPFEKWSQEDYYGLTAFFARLTTKQSQEFGLFGRETIIHTKPTGEVTHPRTRKVVKPHPLDGPEMDDPFDRRRLFGEWLTASDNMLFARNFANRYWGYFMGRGLVEPLDDQRATNPASNPELLDALAKHLIASKFNVKELMRVIMNSRAYQLSSMVVPDNAADATNTHFTRWTIKRLTAEQMADALDTATGVPEKYPGLPLGTRAIQLPDPRIRSYLLDVFGRPPRQQTCECERSTTPNIAQAMHMLNGEFINKKISNPAGRIELAIKAKRPLPQIVEELYLLTLSRLPRPEELQRVQDWIGRAGKPQEGLQDLLWVLLNSREFQFNH